MHDLFRSVRFCVDLQPAAAAESGGSRHNSFAGWPSMAGIGAYYELIVHCRGEADATTGYMTGIGAIDEAVRTRGIGVIRRAVLARPQPGPGAVLRAVLEAIQGPLDGAVASLRWRLTPYYSLTLEAGTMDRVLLSQQFDFAAAHRLHCRELSEVENREIFGKCNNPNGHGHNYRVEVGVWAPIEAASQGAMTLAELERIVDETVIQRFDHRHLNLDTAEFAELNPSVEHIAKVCYELLTGPIGEAGGEVAQVTVWETEKTRCTYAGPKRPV